MKVKGEKLRLPHQQRLGPKATLTRDVCSVRQYRTECSHEDQALVIECRRLQKSLEMANRRDKIDGYLRKEHNRVLIPDQ
jgi:hypothetical protein